MDPDHRRHNVQTKTFLYNTSCFLRRGEMKTQQFLIALGILSMVFTLLVVRHAAPVVTPDIPQPIVRGYHSDGIV